MRTSYGRIAVLLAAVVAAGCSAGGKSTREGDRVGGALGDTLGRIETARTIVLGYRESSPPFSFVREDG
jgi:hypothetical protein